MRPSSSDDPPQRRRPVASDSRSTGNGPRVLLSVRGAGNGRRVLVSARGTRVPVALARIGALADFVLAAERVPRALLGIEFVSTRALSQLHRQLLGATGVTDV